MREIIHEFSLLEAEVDEIPVEQVCLFGLMQLREDTFIGLSASPLTWEENEEAVNEPSRRSLPPQVTNTQQPWPPLSAKA